MSLVAQYIDYIVTRTEEAPIKKELLDVLRTSKTATKESGLNDVFMFDEHVVKLHGNCLYEVGGLELARKHLSRKIQVPQVIDYSHKYIVMERLDAEPLRSKWCCYSDEDKDYIIKQVADLIYEMSQVKSKYIGRVLANTSVEKPQTLSDRFHEALNKIVVYYPKIEHLRESFAQYSSTNIVWSHGDLHDGNILVKGNEIHSLIDWEYSMYRPIIGAYEFPHVPTQSEKEYDYLHDLFVRELGKRDTALSDNLYPKDMITSLIMTCVDDDVDWNRWVERVI